MRVSCSANTGKALAPRYLVGNTPESVFHVTVGRDYEVFAIAVYRGAPLLLLSDDNGLPNWYPVDLFSISDPRVSVDWLAASYPDNATGLQFLLGYGQLISDESHYDALLERSPEAMEVFRQQTSLLDT